MAGLQHMNSLEDPAARGAGGTQAEDLAQTLPANGGVYARVFEQALDLRAKGQPPIGEGVKQRLHPKAVPAQEDAAPGDVVHGKGENAVELLRAALSIAEVGVQDHLGVTVRVKAVAPALQVRPELGGVVKLPVVGDGALAPLLAGGHGLLAVLGVDDRQAHVGQGAVGGHMGPLAVWAPVGDPAGHAAGQSHPEVFLV